MVLVTEKPADICGISGQVQGDEYEHFENTHQDAESAIPQGIDTSCADCGETDFCDCLPVGRDIQELIAEQAAFRPAHLAGLPFGLDSAYFWRHSLACVDASWTRFGVSPITAHECTCGESPDYESVNEERNRLGVEEIDHRRERIARDRRRWEQYDTPPDNLEGVPSGDALDAFTATFTGQPPIPEPALMEVGDRTILYANRLNWVFGYPGTGKSWVGLLACREAVKLGGKALYLDFEDNAATLESRARLIGFDVKAANEAGNFLYGRPGLTDSPLAVDQAQDWLSTPYDGNLYAHVVIDAAESSGAPSDGGAVNEWLGKLVEPWRNVGAGVTVLDHKPKNKDNQSRGPIGSQRKLAAVDGVALEVKGLPWTKARDGRISLVVAKDRPGDVGGVDQTVAAVSGTWAGADSDRAIRIELVDANAADAPDGLGDRILAAVDSGQCASANDVVKAVKGNRNDVHRLIRELTEEAFIEKRGGWFMLTDKGQEQL